MSVIELTPEQEDLVVLEFAKKLYMTNCNELYKALEKLVRENKLLTHEEKCTEEAHELCNHAEYLIRYLSPPGEADSFFESLIEYDEEAIESIMYAEYVDNERGKV